LKTRKSIHEKSDEVFEESVSESDKKIEIKLEDE
jgi:hypothetical protein